jgi:hypothetical protein
MTRHAEGTTTNDTPQQHWQAHPRGRRHEPPDTPGTPANARLVRSTWLSTITAQKREIRCLLIWPYTASSCFVSSCPAGGGMSTAVSDTVLASRDTPLSCASSARMPAADDDAGSCCLSSAALAMGWCGGVLAAAQPLASTASAAGAVRSGSWLFRCSAPPSRCGLVCRLVMWVFQQAQKGCARLAERAHTRFRTDVWRVCALGVWSLNNCMMRWQET